MPTPPDRFDVAARWLRWAREDVVPARHTAADAELVARGACTWAHQAAEKAIKGLLVAFDVDPPKSHDLDRLVHRLPAGDVAALTELDLPELTRWSIEGRYPADLDEATTQDATSAIAIADQVVARVIAVLADLPGQTGS